MLATVAAVVRGKRVEHGPYEVHSLNRIYGEVILSANGHMFVESIENIRLLEPYKYKWYSKYKFNDVSDQLKEAS